MARQFNPVWFYSFTPPHVISLLLRPRNFFFCEIWVFVGDEYDGCLLVVAPSCLQVYRHVRGNWCQGDRKLQFLTTFSHVHFVFFCMNRYESKLYSHNIYLSSKFNRNPVRDLGRKVMVRWQTCSSRKGRSQSGLRLQLKKFVDY